jgi:DNA-binding transcriptional regulator LsrR (DeoR family)
MTQSSIRAARRQSPKLSRRRRAKPKLDVVMEAATRFYLKGQTQSEIGREMALDPSTISRYVKQARDEGIVRVEIRQPRREHLDVGRGLAEQFGLQRAVVVPGDWSSDTVGQAAAGYVEGVLRRGMRLGISWGESLAATIGHLRAGLTSDVTIAQLAGGIGGTTPGIRGHELILTLSNLYPDSRVHYLQAPAIVDSPAVQKALIENRIIRDVLAVAAQSHVALVGIGQLSSSATVVREGDLRPKDYATLLDSGAVGNVNLRYFDIDGRPVNVLEDRTIAVTWEELRAIPSVVAIAGGRDKAQAILGALRSGCIDVLITDELTAGRLMSPSQ